MKEAISVSEKYGLSLEAGLALVKAIDENTPEGGDNNLKSRTATGGISSLAAIGGGGRIGKLASIDDQQLQATKEQTSILSRIEKNTAKTNTNGFK